MRSILRGKVDASERDVSHRCDHGALHSANGVPLVKSVPA